MAKENPLYGDPQAWAALPLADQLEAIRLDLCTGPCGSSQSVMDQRSRIDKAIKDALRVFAAIPPRRGKALDQWAEDNPY